MDFLQFPRKKIRKHIFKSSFQRFKKRYLAKTPTNNIEPSFSLWREQDQSLGPEPELPRLLDFSDLPFLFQEQSIFFKLPAEIRQEIYHYVLGDRLIHLDFQPRRKYVKGNPYPRTGWLYRRQICEYAEYNISWTHPCANILPQHRSQNYDPNSKLLALPLACVRLYQEAIPVLYSSNHFDMIRLDIEDIQSLLTTCISPRRLACMRSLEMEVRMYYYETSEEVTMAYKSKLNFWLQFRTMFPNLRNLKIRIITSCWNWLPNWQRETLQSLIQTSFSPLITVIGDIPTIKLSLYVLGSDIEHQFIDTVFAYLSDDHMALIESFPIFFQ
jgi:hypothetical protein